MEILLTSVAVIDNFINLSPVVYYCAKVLVMLKIIDMIMLWEIEAIMTI